jgi:DNA polymerase III epsilon subunit-like protein
MSSPPIRICWYDTESTSLGANAGVIEFAAVITERDEFKEIPGAEFRTLISTNQFLNPHAQKVHGISKASLVGQPTFPEAMEKFKLFVKEHLVEPGTMLILVAHNQFNFDLKRLQANAKEHHMDFDQFLDDICCYGYVDTMHFIRALMKGCPDSEQPKDPVTGKSSCRLGHCFAKFVGKPLENAHSALADTKGLVDVFRSPCVSAKITPENWLGQVRVRKEEANESTVRKPKRKRGNESPEQEKVAKLNS